MTLLTILCAACLLMGLPAAAPPSFAGQWLIDLAASDLDGSASGWFGNTVTITQDDKTITFSSGGSEPGTGTSSYRLDGARTTRTAPTGPNAGTVRETWARWEGERLLLISRSTSLPDPVTKKPRVSERTVTVQITRDGALVVDVVVSPESVGKMAKHTVYRRQRTGKVPSHTPVGVD